MCVVLVAVRYARRANWLYKSVLEVYQSWINVNSAEMILVTVSVQGRWRKVRI